MARGPAMSVLMCVMALLGCGDDTPTSTRPFEDGQSISQATNSDTADSKSDISSLPGYDTVSQFLAVLLAQNENLRDSVNDAASFAECILTNAYQLNGIPISNGNDQGASTSVPVESLLSPMLVYLAEVCSGIPASSWAK